MRISDIEVPITENFSDYGYPKLDKYIKLSKWYMEHPEVLDKYPNSMLYAKTLKNKFNTYANDLLPDPSDDLPATPEDWDMAKYAIDKSNVFNNFYKDNIEPIDYVEDLSYNNTSELNDLLEDFGDTNPQTGSIVDNIVDDGTVQWVPGLNRQLHRTSWSPWSQTNTWGLGYINSHPTPISRTQLATQPSHILRRLYDILQK